MLLIAGITTSVLMQTMQSLQDQALQTGQETIREVSGGVKVTQVSGYTNGLQINQLALFVTPIAASADIDMMQGYIALSDSIKKVILRYNSSCFNDSITAGLFSSINSSHLNIDEFGIIKIRDVDNSCSSNSPIINNGDLIVLLINTTTCFSGIGTRTEISGSVIPEYGINGVIGFTTPSTFSTTIIDLQT
jgi:flagellin FlaB